MSVSMRNSFLLAMVIVFSCEGFASAQAAPQQEPFTLWRFLGIPQGIRRVRGNLVNRRGNFPGLEQRPPMRALADPRNLVSPNPAIKAAADIKAAELLAPQKIKALKYLAKMGCGCYDKDGKITNALLAAMADDCTEKVRLEAVRAVSDAARCQVCDHCNMKCCCNEKIIQQLAAIAYERDEFGCWLEPSARVRQAAVQALGACCSGEPPELLPPPIEGIEGNEGREGTEGVEPLPPTPVPTSETRYAPAPVVAADVVPSDAYSMASPSGALSSHFNGQTAGSQSHLSTGTVEGAVMSVNHWQANASVRFTTDNMVPIGTQLYVYQYGPEGVRPVGSLMVSSSRPGEASVIARPGTLLTNVSKGDVVIGTAAGR